VLPPEMSKSPQWLHDEKTLHEQDITEDTELQYAKRFHYSDDYVDKDDPFTLHLLYVGSNKSIISGQYPVSQEQASEFAGLQLQILFGNHKPKEHEGTFLDLNLILPKRYRKVKNIERDIIKFHQTFVGLDETKAKYRYVQTVRGLPSYGTTYFECTEEVRKGRALKKKVIFIGVTKERIVIMNPKTQEVTEEYVWKQIARWSFKGDTFVFDFGDYRANYLEVTSPEALAMNTLISGYIDIILKELQTTARVVDPEEDFVANVEEITGDFGLQQFGATSTYNNPYLQGGLAGMMGGGHQQAWALPGGGPGGGGLGSLLSPSMNTNVVDMGSAMKAAKMLSNELATQKGMWGQKGAATEDQWNSKFNDHKTLLNQGVSDLLGMVKLGDGKMNRQNLDVKAKDLMMNMMNMSQAARALNAHNADNAPLLDGAKAVADSMADLMSLLMRNLDDPLGHDALVAALEAADRMFADAQLLLSDPQLAQYVDKGAELLMLNCIEDVDRNMLHLTDLVSRAAEELVPAQLKELEADIGKVNAVKGFTLTSLRQLVPIILDKRVPLKVEIARKTLDDLSKALSNHARKMVPGQFHTPLDEAAARVAESLANLLAASQTAELRAVADVDINTPLHALIADAVSLKSAVGHPKKVENLIAQMKATEPTLTGVVKTLHSVSPIEVQKALTASSEGVHTSLQALFVTAEALEKDPDNLDLQKKLSSQCDPLVTQLQLLEQAAVPITSLNELRYNAKAVCASVMQLNSGAILALGQLDNSAGREALLQACGRVKDGFGGLLVALQASVHDPLNLNKTINLISVLKTHIPHHSQLSTEAKKSSKQITNLNQRQELDLAAELVSKNIRAALVSANKVSNQSGLYSVEAALEDFDAVKAILDHNVLLINSPDLQPLQGQTREDAQALLAVSCAALNKSIANLTAAAKQGPGQLEAPIRASAVAMSQIVATLLPLAATTSDIEARQKLLKGVQNIYDATIAGVTTGKDVAFSSQTDQKAKAEEKNLFAKQKAINEAALVLLATAQQLNEADLDETLAGIEKAKQGLRRNLKADMSYFEASQALLGVSAAVAAGVSHLSAVARYDTPMLSASGNVLGADTVQLLELCSLAASVAPGDDTANGILAAAKNLSDAMIQYYAFAKNAAAKPTPENFQKLTDLERQILDLHLARVVGALGVSTSAEAQQAIAKINGTLAGVNELEAVAAMPLDIRHEFVANTKEISRAIGALVSSGRAGLPIENGLAAKEAATAIRNLIGAAKCAQDSDGHLKPLSLEGMRLVKGTDQIVENIDDPRKALQVAKKVTGNAFNLINNAKQLAKADPNARADITRDAQAVVKTTTQLAEVAKIAAAKRSPLALQQLAKMSTQLKGNVQQLEASMLLAKSNQPTVPVEAETARILMATTQKIALHTIEIIKASSSVAINPNDQTEGAALNKTTKELTNAISSVMKVSNNLSPSILACERAVVAIQKVSADLEDASNKALAKQLTVPGVASTTLLQAQRDTMQTCKGLAVAIKGVIAATQDNSEALGASVEAVVKQLPEFQQRVLLVAGNIEDHYEQGQLLALSKALTDSLAGFVKVIPTVTPDDPKTLNALFQAGALTTEALGLLMGQLKEGNDVATGLKNSEATIKASLDNLEASLDTSFSYDQCKDDLVKSARDLAAAMSSLVSLDWKNQNVVQGHMNKLADVVPQFVTTARHLAGASAQHELSDSILASTKQVVEKNVLMAELVQDLCVGKDSNQKLIATFNDATGSLASLLALAKEGATSEKSILEAQNKLTHAGNQVNQGYVLAKTGLLDADKELLNAMVSDLQKKSTKDIKNLINTSGGLAAALDHQNTEQLAKSALAFADQVVAASDATILVARRMNHHQKEQVEVLTSLKGLVGHCDGLVNVSKTVFQNPTEREAHREKVKVLASQIEREARSLSDAIKASSAEAVRGEKELNSFKQAIKNLIENTKGTPATAQDVMAAARQVFEISSELVFAADSDASVEAGKKSVPAVAVLLDVSRGAALLSHDPAVQDAVIEGSVGVARAMMKLLDVSKLNKEEPETQAKLEEVSSVVNDALNNLVAAVQRLPGASNLFLHMQDLDFVAEGQLQQTAEAIAQCHSALVTTKKPSKAKKSHEEVDQTDINNALLDASAAIANATQNLVTIGSTIQKGRAAAKKGRDIRQRPVKTDPTALKALIGASLETEKAIKTLTQNTQQSVVKLQEQALNGSAKSITAATSHMVAALKAGSQSHESGLTEQLTNANQAVAEAIGQLLSATHRAASFTEETEVIVVPSTGKVRELEIQVAILKLEKAIKKEKRRLDAMVAASANK